MYLDENKMDVIEIEWNLIYFVWKKKKKRKEDGEDKIIILFIFLLENKKLLFYQDVILTNIYFIFDYSLYFLNILIALNKIF